MIELIAGVLVAAAIVALAFVPMPRLPKSKQKTREYRVVESETPAGRRFFPMYRDGGRGKWKFFTGENMLFPENPCYSIDLEYAMQKIEEDKRVHFHKPIQVHYEKVTEEKP